MLIPQVSPAAVASGQAASARPEPAPTPVSVSAAASTPQVDQTAQAKEAASADEVQTAVKTVNQAVQSFTSSLEFSVDEETGIRLVKVVDTQTKDVIRQVPAEEVVAIARALNQLKGIVIQAQA